MMHHSYTYKGATRNPLYTSTLLLRFYHLFSLFPLLGLRNVGRQVPREVTISGRMNLSTLYCVLMILSQLLEDHVEEGNGRVT
ncbi:hypothetical protein OE88DRAFT_846115 [Heliocybe sulcata]|uniref:Uncharacterized protein n=1 Tax=Heliocybe sulcata TaxID=5364 RepID=A0A5C3MQF5_9AGAM|nr:hypothetical protein OE88DRAFT_846115 [Heliocybe sulcata]